MYKLDEEKNIVNKTCVQIRKHENDTWYMEIPESWAEELSEISDVWIIGKGIEKGTVITIRLRYLDVKE